MRPIASVYNSYNSPISYHSYYSYTTALATSRRALPHYRTTYMP